MRQVHNQVVGIRCSLRDVVLVSETRIRMCSGKEALYMVSLILCASQESNQAYLRGRLEVLAARSSRRKTLASFECLLDKECRQSALIG